MPMGEMGDHHLLATNGVNIGALMRSQAGHAPCWIYSIGVDDIDAAMEQIKAGGGQVLDLLNGPGTDALALELRGDLYVPDRQRIALG